MTDDDFDLYDPEGFVVCDRCDGDGEIEEGDDCIAEEIMCPVCHGDGEITKERWEKRMAKHRELMKALWGIK